MKPDEMFAASSPVVSHKIRQKALPQFFALGCDQSLVHCADTFAMRANDRRIDPRGYPAITAWFSTGIFLMVASSMFKCEVTSS
jgi:hypothetical protein